MTTMTKSTNDLEQINTDNDNHEYQVKWGNVKNIMTTNSNSHSSSPSPKIDYSQGSSQAVSNISDLQAI